MKEQLKKEVEQNVTRNALVETVDSVEKAKLEFISE